MQLLKGVNSIIYFLVKLSMLISLGYVGFKSTQRLYGNYLLTLLLPLVAATLWGVFMAPARCIG